MYVLTDVLKISNKKRLHSSQTFAQIFWKWQGQRLYDASDRRTSTTLRVIDSNSRFLWVYEHCWKHLVKCKLCDLLRQHGLTKVEVGAIMWLEEYSAGFGMDICSFTDQQLHIGTTPPLNGYVESGLACQSHISLDQQKYISRRIAPAFRSLCVAILKL